MLLHAGIDLVDCMREWESGAGPSPALLLSIIWALPEDCMTKALMRGGREFFGWSRSEMQLADIYDALNMNTRVTGQWKKSPPDFPEYPRPQVKKIKPKVSVMSLHSTFMNKGLAHG